MSGTPLRADPGPVRRWHNPGEPGWQHAQVRPGRSTRWGAGAVSIRSHGYVWWCPNHPETRSGTIRGISRWRGASRDEALERLHAHFRRYHGAS